MTGSAFKAMDVVVACLSYEKGGGLEEGGLEIDPGRREADLFICGVFFGVFVRRVFGYGFIRENLEKWCPMGAERGPKSLKNHEK